jgi:AhpD family alkylhydroperoxidase
MTTAQTHTPLPARFKLQSVAPDMSAAMAALERSSKAGISSSLRELVKTRASQINGCAFCLDMHTKDARAAGETEQRLYALNAWRETPFFTEEERAALALTEALTDLRDHERLGAAWDAAGGYFEGRGSRRAAHDHCRYQRVEPDRDRVTL